jgi:tRNA pseudouridine55 synthase
MPRPRALATPAGPDADVPAEHGAAGDTGVAADGLLIVDKPAGWTSHDVVAVARALTRTRRVGHAGTLDPMATGLLVLGVGRATRLLTFLVGCDKTYAATIRLGQSTVTDDADGEVASTADASALTQGQVDDAIAELTGRIEQVPSSVSAVKVGGVRSYARVRAGQDVDLAARTVTVTRFELLGRKDGRHTDPSSAVGDGGKGWVDLEVVVDVSSGTYVRALARDLGARLGVGGHLTALRRTRVGRFSIGQASALDLLREPGADLPLISLEAAARTCFEVRELSQAETAAVMHGQRIPAAETRLEPVAAFAPDGRLVALLDESASVARSRVVFPA